MAKYHSKSLKPGIKTETIEFKLTPGEMVAFNKLMDKLELSKTELTEQLILEVL